jgi:acyl dehydratase
MHLDAEAARSGQFGGLIASGWHTAALWMRLFAVEFLNRAAALTSPGVEDLRWLRPVRAGDELSARYEILEAIASERHPARGTLRGRGELRNQHGEVVLRLVARNQFRRRG